MPSRIPRPEAPPDTAAPRRAAWLREPVVWLGAVILAASLAGCVWMIVLATRHADVALPLDGAAVMRVPLARPMPPAEAPR